MRGSLLPPARGWPLAAALALAGLLALALAACGGAEPDGDATASPTATPSAPATGTATPSGTATVDDAADGLIVLEGVFETGFEHAAFYPEATCPAGEERYWVSWLPESRFDERIEEETGIAPFAEPDVRAFAVTIRGELSERGDFGYLGQYPREVTVHELIAAAPLDSLSGCDDSSGSGGGVVPPLRRAPRR